ncbi:DUF3325 family protein [Gluconacetobacter sacchari]|uniref:DUF3325 family protein n=2 Tax=Gluconacetobacter sacchari TaxID=92759 RepID=A0A7W4IEG3_9PROT|nr:DUF3325 family protein [Gluconacetobacter sacchari]MBB2161252.1 DUF3325 family protein [Gluconacetobacter sacchari]
MAAVAILGELAGALLLALGNARGGHALLRRPVPPARRRLARNAGFCLLGAALWGLIRAEGDLLFALTAWALSSGSACILAALACTMRDRAPVRPTPRQTVTGPLS